MATPPRLIEFQCPDCCTLHWEIDHDIRVSDEDEVPYCYRNYACPGCGRAGTGFSDLQKSPPEFFIQPNLFFPITKVDFDYWVEVLRKHIPDHPRLKELHVHWYPVEPVPGGMLSGSIPAPKHALLVPWGEPSRVVADGFDGSSLDNLIVTTSIEDQHRWLAAHFPGWRRRAHRLLITDKGPVDCFTIGLEAESRNIFMQISREGEHRGALRTGPPCPFCGELLRTAKAKQCGRCGMDWHADPPRKRDRAID